MFSQDDDRIESSANKKWYQRLTEPMNLLFIGLVIFYFLFKGYKTVEADWATLWALGLAGLFSFAVLLEAKLRELSPKFITNGINTSTVGPIPAGNYYIFTMGDVDTEFEGLKYRGFRTGKTGIIAVPMDTVVRVGDNWISPVHPIQVEYDELDDDVKREVARYGLRPPYYMGEVDIETVEQFTVRDLEASGVSKEDLNYLGFDSITKNGIVHLIKKNLHLLKMVSESDKLLRDKYKPLETAMQSMGRMHMANPSVKEALIERLRGRGGGD